MNPTLHLDKSLGAMLGLACGDAVGSSVEFMERGTFEKVTDMRGGGPFKLDPGMFTDDTSMALCLAQSLEHGYDPNDQMTRYIRWWRDGENSCRSYCFDIGQATLRALDAYTRDSSDPYKGHPNPYTAGNGNIMRLAPIVIRYGHQPQRAIDYAVDQSKVTHQAPECLQAAYWMATVMTRALQHGNKDALLTPPDDLGWSDKMHDLVHNTWKSKTTDDIVGSGYVVQSLEAALWCFYHTGSIEECILMATNLGDDADTTAAIAGQIAGIYYGASTIPARWLDLLYFKEELYRVVNALHGFALKELQLER